jgi:putative redox protein
MAVLERSISSESTPQVVNTIVTTWRGGRCYTVNRPGNAAVATIDGAAVAGPSPVDVLLGAFASCSSIDVVEYLQKRRTPPEAFRVTVVGERRSTSPRRVLRATLEFEIDGPGLDREHTERAVALSIETYCSVAASLAPDVVIDTRVTLNGATGRLTRQHVGAGA